MKKVDLLGMLKRLEMNGDALVDVMSDKIDVMIKDVEDYFDEDYSTIDRDYTDETLVDNFLNKLKDEADLLDDNLYKTYLIDGIKVQVGFSSFDE